MLPTLFLLAFLNGMIKPNVMLRIVNNGKIMHLCHGNLGKPAPSLGDAKDKPIFNKKNNRQQRNKNA